MTETVARAVGEIRRYYEGTKVPVVPTSRAREDVLQLLEERKAFQRAGEALVAAAAPYSGDVAVKQAIDAFKAVLEGRRA
jgi:hypothetical protein